MDKIDEISLSAIATILNKNKIVRTENNSKWDRILSNAGQSELYYKYSNSLNPYSYNGNWKNSNDGFEEFYSAIKNILKTVYRNGESVEEFTVLMGTILEEVSIFDLFDYEIGDLSQSKVRIQYKEIEKKLRKSSDEEITKFILEKADNDFLLLVNNLNVLNLDIKYSNKKLILMPFTKQSSHIHRNPSALMDWLNENYLSIGELYEEAVNNYITGQSISCISNCRNILTGIFSHFKNDENKLWNKGLQNLSTDTNIENINVPNNIIQGSANKNINFENDNKFKYPRFSLISSLYSLLSDLGPHSAEAPKIDGKLYPETITLNDALLCLRMTEDVLIWVKERLKSYPE